MASPRDLASISSQLCRPLHCHATFTRTVKHPRGGTFTTTPSSRTGLGPWPDPPAVSCKIHLARSQEFLHRIPAERSTPKIFTGTGCLGSGDDTALVVPSEISILIALSVLYFSFYVVDVIGDSCMAIHVGVKGAVLPTKGGALRATKIFVAFQLNIINHCPCEILDSYKKEDVIPFTQCCSSPDD
jgi:hypothetical protein